MTDYDRTDLPAGYDRARDHGPEVLDLWMRTVAECVDEHAIARILDRVQYALGRAEAIPLPPESVDLVFMSMSLHHFADRLAAAHECRRVLSPTGRVVIRTGTRERISSYPCIPFFASSRRLHEEVLPESSDIQADFAAAGLHTVASKIVPQTIAADWMAYADKLAAGGDSVLARLNPEEFEEGLAAVRHYAEAEGRRPVVEAIDFFVLSAHPPVAAR